MPRTFVVFGPTGGDRVPPNGEVELLADRATTVDALAGAVLEGRTERTLFLVALPSSAREIAARRAWLGERAAFLTVPEVPFEVRLLRKPAVTVQPLDVVLEDGGKAKVAVMRDGYMAFSLPIALGADQEPAEVQSAFRDAGASGTPSPVRLFVRATDTMDRVEGALAALVRAFASERTPPKIDLLFAEPVVASSRQAAPRPSTFRPSGSRRQP